MLDPHGLIEKRLTTHSDDPGWAVAFALLELAKAGDRIANALHRLGTADAATPMGAIELLASEVAEIAPQLNSLGEAVFEIGDVLGAMRRRADEA